MALTDWPLVILVVEVTEKKTENSQPSLRNRGNVCGIHTSWIMICSLVLPQALSTTSQTDACGALSTTSRNDTLTRHEATRAPSTTSRKDIRVPIYPSSRKDIRVFYNPGYRTHTVPVYRTGHWDNRTCVAVTVALTDNFSRELGEGAVHRSWIKVGGAKAWIESLVSQW